MLSIETVFLNIRLADILDIVVIAVCFYVIFLWIKQRASRSVTVAIASTAGLYVLARLLDMYLTLQLFRAGLAAILVALVLIFQEDIRRAFARLAIWQPGRSGLQPVATSQQLDTLIESIAMLTHHKIGALVVLKGREVLERHMHGGVTVNGEMSLPLLYSIFHPQSPGHDGAVLIEGNRIEKLGVHLPLSTNLSEIGLAGTRHAAALGLAERSDALIIVVSEERGTVSVAEHGRLASIDSLAALKERLQRFYQQTSSPAAEPARFSCVTSHLGAKCAALALASLLWLLVARHTETVQRIFTVPIEYRNLAASVTLEEPRPIEARVILSGQERAFHFDSNSLVISLDLSGLREGSQEIVITEENLHRPPNLTVHQIEPQVVKLRAQQMIETTLPVKIPLQGYLPAQLTLLGVGPQPATVRVRIQRSRRQDVTAIRTEPLRLSDVSKSTTVPLKLILPEYVRLAEGESASIRVTVEVAEPPPATP